METAAPQDFVNLLWTFVNSPIGLLVIGTVVTGILGKIFTWKPAWKVAVLKYGPSLMSAIKQAEKAIPDGTENKSLARLDAAMKFAIALEPKLNGLAEADVKAALTAVHTQAESNNNL